MRVPWVFTLETHNDDRLGNRVSYCTEDIGDLVA